MTPSRLVGVLERQYPFTVADIIPLDSRRNDVYRIETPDGTYVAKLYSRSVNLTVSHRLLERLRDASFEVPMPINSTDGTRCVELDERVLTLSEFHDGRRFDSSEEQVRAAAEALSEIHTLGREPDSCEVGDPSESASRYLTTLREKRDDWIASGLLSTIEYEDVVQAASQAADRLFRDFQTTSAVYIHGDYIGQNVLFDNNNEVAVVLDWENVRCDLAYAEVANAANVFAVSLSEGSSAAIDPERLGPFLTTYRQTRETDFKPEILFEFMIRESVSSVVWGFKNYTEREQIFYRDVGEWWINNLQSLLNQRQDVLTVISDSLETS